jgi:hypothetical protein
VTAARWLLSAALLMTAGCGGGGGDGDPTHLRLVVADKSIRREGVECAGALPFQYVHAGAPFRIETGDGDVVAEGELPAGRARNAEPDIDWEVERIPTVCVVDFDVDLPDAARYRLLLERGRPLVFAVDPRTQDKPIALVIG